MLRKALQKKLWHRSPVGASVLQERNTQQTFESVMLIFVHVGIDPVNNISWPENAEGTEQPIPDRKNIPVIRIGVRQLIMVVNFVHIRGNDYVAQPLIEFSRQRNVCMIELREYHRQRLVQKNQPHWAAAHQYRQHCEYETDHTFSWMMPVGTCRIDPGVGMMNQVKPPHPGRFVLCEMGEPCPDEIQ